MNFIVAAIYAFRKSGNDDAPELILLLCMLGMVELCIYGAMLAGV